MKRSFLILGVGLAGLTSLAGCFHAADAPGPRVADVERTRAAFVQQDAQSLAEKEASTPLWFAVQFDAKTFAIFDAFSEAGGREAHLTGKIAAALMAQASNLLADAPKIEKFDIAAQKVHLGEHGKECRP